jgi:hypothetical protein
MIDDVYFLIHVLLTLGAHHVLSKPKGIHIRKSLGNRDLKGPLETIRYFSF